MKTSGAIFISGTLMLLVSTEVRAQSDLVLKLSKAPGQLTLSWTGPAGPVAGYKGPAPATVLDAPNFQFETDLQSNTQGMPPDNLAFFQVVGCKLALLAAGGGAPNHVDIGHWGADRGGNEIDGYTAAPNDVLVNGAGGAFIDTDPDRFSVELNFPAANANAAVAETVRAKLGTLTGGGNADDDETEIDLLETGANTGIFRSEQELLMSPDLPAADNPDDLTQVHSVRAGAAVADDQRNDRTHRATTDGSVRVTYTTPGNKQCQMNPDVPVCDRAPNEARRTLTTRVRVYREPFQDVGWDHDNNAATPDIGANNGTFDFTDVIVNGRHDAGEPSEPYIDMSNGGAVFRRGDAAGVANGRGGVASSADVTAQLARANIAWAQACVRITQNGATIEEEAPNDGAGVNVLADGSFQIAPAQDDVAAITAIAGDQIGIVETIFTGPMPGANGYARVPANQGANLPAAKQEISYLFLAPALDIRNRTLAHEIGHGLTNQGDGANRPYVFFPALTTQLDNADNLYRRIRHDSEATARSARAAGNLGAAGNRVLTTP